MLHYNYRQIYLVMRLPRLSIIITCPTGEEFEHVNTAETMGIMRVLDAAL